MRFSKMLLPTLRQVPADSDSTSQILMQRGAMIKKVSSGLFTYLPYFNMVLKRVSEVIHNGMANLNAQECKFPILVSKDLLDDSGRWESFGSEMFRLKDRSGKDYAISPTNEEAACQTAMSYITSYNDLPLTVYQIQQKHRDEIRPRCGVMRAREFIMKDAYSFHAGDEDLDIVYHKFLEEYIKIFNTLGIDVVAVAADSGAMGGSGSQEVMALSPEGDAMLAMCSKCGMSANLETVECPDEEAEWAERHAPEKVFTPNIRTIEDLSAFFNVSEKQFAKSMVYKADKHLVVAVLRGDREVNEIKLKRITGADVVEFASFEEIQTKLNSVMGFVGPIGLGNDIRVLIDNEIKVMKDFITGANVADYHYKNVNNRDFAGTYCDLRNAVPGDSCPVCGEKYEVRRADELGHCFKLGTRYTDKFDITYMDSDGQSKRVTMGCYGIGLERTVAAIINQHHDDNGIIWPINVAPFQVNIIPTEMNTAEISETAELLYKELLKAGIRTIIDDRPVRAGVKFKDSDLLGMPIKLIVGKRFTEDRKIEVAFRTGERSYISENDCVAYVTEAIEKR